MSHRCNICGCEYAGMYGLGTPEDYAKFQDLVLDERVRSFASAA